MAPSILKLSDLGLVGFACLSSGTWREAIECCARFQRLLESGPLSGMSRVRQTVHANGSGGVVLRIEPRDPASEADAASLVARWVESWRCWLESSGAACRVAPHGEIHLTRAALDTPLEMANAEVHALLLEQCRRALEALAQKERLLEQVRREVEALAYQRVDSDRIASRLRMSARTVRRNLARRGTSYHDVVMEQRMTLAKRYLKDPGMPIKQISSSLGYADISSFHRAFRLHVGLTPGQFRGQAAQAAG